MRTAAARKFEPAADLAARLGALPNEPLPWDYSPWSSNPGCGDARIGGHIAVEDRPDRTSRWAMKSSGSKMT